MKWHNWLDALAVANARAQVTGRRQDVWRDPVQLVWCVAEISA